MSLLAQLSGCVGFALLERPPRASTQALLMVDITSRRRNASKRLRCRAASCGPVAGACSVSCCQVWPQRLIQAIQKPDGYRQVRAFRMAPIFPGVRHWFKVVAGKGPVRPRSSLIHLLQRSRRLQRDQQCASIRIWCSCDAATGWAVRRVLGDAPPPSCSSAARSSMRSKARQSLG